MQKLLALLTLPAFLFTAIFTLAQAASVDHDYVERAVLTSEVSEREPVDDLGDSYSHSGSDYDRLVFFTHMINHDGRGINHRWYRNGELEAEISLAVGSDSWRTYSAKRIHHLATGDWTVRVVNDRGDELVSYPFTVN